MPKRKTLLDVGCVGETVFMNKFNTIISACLVGIPCRYNKKGELNEKVLDIFTAILKKNNMLNIEEA